jgi:hypothetical protein
MPFPTGLGCAPPADTGCICGEPGAPNDTGPLGPAALVGVVAPIVVVAVFVLLSCGCNSFLHENKTATSKKIDRIRIVNNIYEWSNITISNAN